MRPFGRLTDESSCTSFGFAQRPHERWLGDEVGEIALNFLLDVRVALVDRKLGESLSLLAAKQVQRVVGRTRTEYEADVLGRFGQLVSQARMLFSVPGW